MRKTIRQWLHLISDSEVKERALANLEAGKSTQMESGIHMALAEAFIWKDSPEGLEYWAKASEAIPKTDSNGN